MKTRLPKFIFIALIVIVLATVASAFAAANTVPTSYAGDGFGTISGYDVSGVHYTLSATDPRNIATVTFTLDHNASDVRVKLVAASTSFTTCSIAGGVNVTCNISGVTAAQADQLTVIAVE